MQIDFSDGGSNSSASDGPPLQLQLQLTRRVSYFTCAIILIIFKMYFKILLISCILLLVHIVGDINVNYFKKEASVVVVIEQ